MTASAEVGGVVNALKGVMRRASLTMNPSRARLAGRAVLTLAELAFTQMGIPGAVACCEYLVGRWGSAVNPPCHAAPGSTSDVRDQERN
jgi:hypothetical protein